MWVAVAGNQQRNHMGSLSHILDNGSWKIMLATDAEAAVGSLAVGSAAAAVSESSSLELFVRKEHFSSHASASYQEQNL
jgi:hypothetical protein